MDEILSKFKVPLLILLVGAIVTALGIIFFKSDIFSPSTKVEVLPARNASQSDVGGNATEIIVDISGEVERPGVYKLPNGSRVDDLLISSGGFSKNADRSWTDKYLNRASKLVDGQKLYIPNYQSSIRGAKTGGGDQTISSSISSDSNGLININTADLKSLDSLPGIGQTYGQNIIEHRPYSDVQELVSKGAIKQGLFEKIKDKITIY